MKVVLNSDKEKVDRIRKMLKENEGYCPCSILKTKDTKCTCKNFRDQIERREPGYCHCVLYQIIIDD